VLGALGADVPEDEFEAMRLLQEKTGVPAPASLAGLREKPVRFTQVVEKDGIRAAALAL
jgi:threonine synthase